MDDRRKFHRFPLALHACYVDSLHQENRDCYITEISREGLAMVLPWHARAWQYLKGRLTVDPCLGLEIKLPTKVSAITCVMALKWVQEINDPAEHSIAAGGEISLVCLEDKHLLLDYGYEHWKAAMMTRAH